METTTGEGIDIQPGASVYGSDGEKLGALMEIGPDYLVVEKGLFFPTDYFVPNGAIASIEPDRVTLNLTREEALAQGWDRDPTEQPDLAEETHPRGGARAGDDDDRQPVSGFAARTVGTADESAGTSGLPTELGTIPPAADFNTLGEAPIDVNSAYTESDAGPTGAGIDHDGETDRRPAAGHRDADSL